jgi:uncharacterized protein involved in response to NO
LSSDLNSDRQAFDELLCNSVANLPARQHAQTIAIALILRHSWLVDDITGMTDAALALVQHQRWRAARVRSTPVESLLHITVAFTLRGV